MPGKLEMLKSDLAKFITAANDALRTDGAHHFRIEFDPGIEMARVEEKPALIFAWVEGEYTDPNAQSKYIAIRLTNT